MLTMVLRAICVSFVIGLVCEALTIWSFFSTNNDMPVHCLELGRDHPECLEVLDEQNSRISLSEVVADQQLTRLYAVSFATGIVLSALPVFIGCVFLGLWERRASLRRAMCGLT